VITLVDDERLGSRWKRLKRLVESVADGQALLEKLETARPDVVLLDLVMPKLDGLQVIRKIRESGNDVPVVVIAAKNAVKAAIKPQLAGALDVPPRRFTRLHRRPVCKRACNRSSERSICCREQPEVPLMRGHG
jgi:two-component system response regulator MprA